MVQYELQLQQERKTSRTFMLRFTQFTTSKYFTTNATLYVGAYFANVPLALGFVPVILAFCPSCPDQKLATQWLRCQNLICKSLHSNFKQKNAQNAFSARAR